MVGNDSPASRPSRRARRTGPRAHPNVPGTGTSWPRPVVWVLIGVALLALLAAPAMTGSDSEKIDYSTFLEKVRAGEVASVDVDNETSRIRGEYKDKTEFTTTAPARIPDQDYTLLRERGVKEDYHPPSSNLIGSILLWVLPIGLLILFWWWMGRRAQGQMAGIMSIGRSKAKVYTTEKPKTTFADVAGYEGVKQEIREVVDFLKTPNKFRDIGARIPKGVLLVGPPGTGKTLIARAVAGEAGVPFMSITGSDFMEMFVGVGAARVRDLFQTARKQAPCIIFVDEVDSIGRKRGAGLGGGHDEREQTLNQMLSEMDGFESTEGVVMMAATNRPDILDPALLRPGRFDRQIVVPLPDLEERLPILQVHTKDKRISEDVDLSVIARGTPGMSGADLANLVNEAALHAVRRGAKEVHMDDFEAARDRILMGQRRESMALSGAEKEVIAYHEGGHAVLAYALEHADPVHKVTILPSGMALGVTQQLPIEERHIYTQPYIEDSLVVRLGGPHRRGARLRQPLHRRQQRPRRLHRAGPQDGARVGHERPRRPDGLGLPGHGVPGRGPHAQPGLQRRDGAGGRRGGRADPPQAGGPGPRGARPAARWPRPGGPGPAGEGDHRRRRGRSPGRPGRRLHGPPRRPGPRVARSADAPQELIRTLA